MDQKLQQNYSTSYFFSLGVLKKIYSTLQNPFENVPKDTLIDTILVHDYIRKWVLALKEYKELAKCTTQWDTMAESLVKQNDNRHLFLNSELIEEENEVQLDDGDQMNTESSQRTLMLLSSDSYAFSILETFVDDLNELMNEQLNRLKVTMAEMQ